MKRGTKVNPNLQAASSVIACWTTPVLAEDTLNTSSRLCHFHSLIHTPCTLWCSPHTTIIKYRGAVARTSRHLRFLGTDRRCLSLLCFKEKAHVHFLTTRTSVYRASLRIRLITSSQRASSTQLIKHIARGRLTHRHPSTSIQTQGTCHFTSRRSRGRQSSEKQPVLTIRFIMVRCPLPSGSRSQRIIDSLI